MIFLPTMFALGAAVAIQILLPPSACDDHDCKQGRNCPPPKGGDQAAAEEPRRD